MTSRATVTIGNVAYLGPPPSEALLAIVAELYPQWRLQAAERMAEALARELELRGATVDPKGRFIDLVGIEAFRGTGSGGRPALTETGWFVEGRSIQRFSAGSVASWLVEPFDGIEIVVGFPVQSGS